MTIIEPTTLIQAQEGLPTVTVTVDRKRVPLGEEVTFTLEPRSVVLNPAFMITLYFGDGNQQQVRQTKVIHLYRAVGHYNYSITVKASNQVPQVSLTASLKFLPERRQVLFTAHPSYADPNLSYRFVFGDNSSTDWQANSQTAHAYQSAGTYLAYVDIGVVTNGVVRRMGGSMQTPIQVTHLTSVAVTLRADPISAQVGQPVTFIARSNASEENIAYHFFFGDGASSGWQFSPRVVHSYGAQGQYSAHVQIGSSYNGRIEGLVASETRYVDVRRFSPPPTPSTSPTPVASSSPSRTTSPSPTPTPYTSPTPVASPSPSSTLATSTSPTASPYPPTPGSTPPPIPGHFPWWWIFLIIALLVLLLLLIWLLFGRRRPPFHSHFDPVVPQEPPPFEPPINVGPKLGPRGPFPQAPLVRALERRWLHYAFLSCDNEFGLVANLAWLGPPPDQPRLGTFATAILLLHRKNEGWCASQFNAETSKPFWSAFRQPHPIGVSSPFAMTAKSKTVAVDLALQRSSRPCTSQCAPFADNQFFRWQSETGVIARGDWHYRGQLHRNVEAIGYHERVRGYWGWPEIGGWVFGFANDPAACESGAVVTAPPAAVVFTLIQPWSPSDSPTASVMLWRHGRLLRHFPRRCVSVAIRGELDKDYIVQVPVLSHHLGVPPMATIPRRLIITAAMGKDWVVLDFLCEEAARIVISSETSINPFSVHEVIGPVRVEGQANGDHFTFTTRGIVEFAGGAGGD